MDNANTLRAALKSAGYSARQVSVACPHSTLRVTIRTADVSISAVTEIANKFRRVRYCEATGEILQGGNTFVEVAYHPSVIDPVADDIEARLVEGGRAIVGGTLATVHDDKVFVARGADDCGRFYCYGTGHAANRLAAELLDFNVGLAAQLEAA